MRFSTPLLPAVFLVVNLLHLSAFADDFAVTAQVESAEIQLKNGEMKRGTIVSVEPGQRVIIIVAGEQSVIPWEEVAKIVGGAKEAPANPDQVATIVAPAIAPSPVLAGTKGVPIVRIESNWQGAELSRVEGAIGPNVYSTNNSNQGILSKYICQAPCNKAVDGREGHRFFISAPGMLPSPHFHLDGYEGNVIARVHGTSTWRFVGGVMATGAGSIFALGGAMFFGMSFINASEKPSVENPNPKEASIEVRNAGLAFGAVGFVGLASGIVLLSSGMTRIEIIKSTPKHTGLVLDQGVLRF